MHHDAINPKMEVASLSSGGEATLLSFQCWMNLDIGWLECGGPFWSATPGGRICMGERSVRQKSRGSVRSKKLAKRFLDWRTPEVFPKRTLRNSHTNSGVRQRAKQALKKESQAKADIGC